jgi:drug/metabolite transporter (DMT)-like permease
MGIFPTAIAFTLFNYGLLYDQAGDILIFSYIEAVVGGILTAVVSQSLTVWLIIGGGLIIIANVIIALKKKK